MGWGMDIKSARTKLPRTEISEIGGGGRKKISLTLRHGGGEGGA